ncbi:MAG: tyrosine-type recombinase/integrase [Proteobacteria bacterium]|nr:tyrosine-type recombinase/integrase [Pseudomonadota bacterium]
MPLTDIAVRNAKPKEKLYKLSDMGGLQLHVSPTGARLWRYKYRIAGKESSFSIGNYPDTTLAKAREIHGKARDLVQQGIHPIHHRKQQELERFLASGNTFKSIATDWIAQKKSKWSAYYQLQVERGMRVDVYPDIGSIPIKQITAAHILKIVRTVEKRGAPTVAILIQQWCSSIFSYAVVNLKADYNPVAAIKGVIDRPNVEHNKSLLIEEIPDFIRALSDYGGYRTTCIAIKLLMLTFVRTAELRKAEWKEFDFEKAIWLIPAHKMKMRRPHIVPLSKQSIKLLLELKEWTGSRSVLFPNYRNPSTCMTATTINRAIERMGYSGRFSAHGFRSTASTILRETKKIPVVYIERQLAHAHKNQTEAAYDHAQYLDDRIEMMQIWADFIDTLPNKSPMQVEATSAEAIEAQLI